jgi:hypothetical protein
MGGVLSGKTWQTAGLITGGFIGTKAVSAFALPMIGTMSANPVVRIGVKAGVAAILAYASSMLLSKDSGKFILLGGAVNVLDDAIREYVAPYVPLLASYDAVQLGDYSVNERIVSAALNRDSSLASMEEGY